MDEGTPVRLQLFLARSGIGSRRVCETYISAGRVKVNGDVARTLGTKVLPGKDEVCFDGKTVNPETQHRYIVLNKPKGYLCSNRDEWDRPLAGDLVQPDFTERLFHVGRLDFQSKGIIFYTNDGLFADTVSHPSSEFEKEYVVEGRDPIPDDVLLSFQRGISFEKEMYTCISYRRLNSRKVSITLIEGKNREIRKVFEFYSIPIRNLTRVRLGCVTVEGLDEGEYRHLKNEEIEYFREKKKEGG